jgi:Protein of unknown function (DUF4011)
MNQHPAETVSSLNHDTVESVSVAAMVREGVAKAREKLIDLSLRNGMLNYRHSETSSRHVRIVDVKPEQILETLASGAAIDILALPPVEAIPADEDTEAFRDALKTRRTTDPDWLAAEDARRAAGSRRRGKDKVAERKLRDRVREQLGMPEWRAATDPKTRAKELGIDPSYDLTSNHEAPEHDRTNLQTLFFPDRLEPKLSAIHSSARSLQEDAGISALSCAVGFLEWVRCRRQPHAGPRYCSCRSTCRRASPLGNMSSRSRVATMTRRPMSPCARSCGKSALYCRNTILRVTQRHISLQLLRRSITGPVGASGAG